jgi:2-methylcitrate dehydratase PrpD
MSELHTNPVPLTQAYAEFIVGSHDLSPRAIEVTVLGFTDALGVTLAGAHEPAVLALARWVQEQGGPQAARVVGQTWRVPPAVAAMLNATAAQALD